MYMGDRTEAPGVQTSPGLSLTRKEADAEPTTPEVSQVMAPDALEMGNRKQLSSASGGPEKGPKHTGASEDGLGEPKTQGQRPPSRTGRKQSSRAAQGGPKEPPAHQEQAPPGSELGPLPLRLHTTPKEPQQPGTETEDQRVSPQNPGTEEDQPLGSCQGLECQSPGHQAADTSDKLQLPEPCCTLDNWGQPLGDDAPRESGTPQAKPQEALPEPRAGAHEDSSQEAVPLTPMVTAEEETANPLLPSTPGPQTPKEGVSPPLRGNTVQTQTAPGPLPPPVARDAAERGMLDHAQKQLQELEVAAGAQSPRNPRQGFMKCLLEVEEEEAAQRRASKARLTTRRSPRALTPVPTSVPVNNSAPSLPLALPHAPTSVSATILSRARPLAPGPASAPVKTPGPASGPRPGVRAPPPDLGCRWPELLPQSNERSLSYPKGRQEPGECCLLRLCQNWEEGSEEHLTLKQEEAFRSYFEVFNGPNEVDAQSLKNILLLVGFSLTPAQVEDALMSADVNGDGHVDFQDFLAVMTDTKRFFCSVEQNPLMNMALPNPHTLLFEILSLLVEMLALPEAALEEITNYYQKKMKAGTCKAQEMMESAIGPLQSRKKLPYNPQQADSFEVPERRVLRILGQLKQQNYAANLQSPYAQVPCIPLCPRLDKKMARRKQGNHYVLDQCVPSSLGPDLRSLFFQAGAQGSREHSSDSRKWLSSVPARTH